MPCTFGSWTTRRWFILPTQMAELKQAAGRLYRSVDRRGNSKDDSG
jgi:hypothetical protein